MIVFYICIVLLIFYKIRIGDNLEGYLAKENTNSVKGIFILIIFLCHINPYIVRSGYEFDKFGDQLFLQFPTIISQLVVVMFLFFSGYGVREGIKARGMDYVKTMPKRRILVTLLNFDVAVLFFLLLNLLLGIHPPVSKVLLSLVCWEEIGNSNWYIFAILILYIVAYLFYYCFYHKYPKINGLHFLFTIFVLTLFLSFVRPDWWYNTMFAFAAGVVFSEKKELFTSYCRDHFYVVFFSLLVLFLVLYHLHYDYRSLKFNALSVVFALLIVTIMTRVTINNEVLRWCGEKLFPLYIYQRIPMLFIEKISGGKEFISTSPELYSLVCIMVTVLIACTYKYFAIKKI